MKKEMLINVLQPEECRIAIVEDGVLEELYVERSSQESYVGNIYKGRIVNIEPTSRPRSSTSASAATASCTSPTWTRLLQAPALEGRPRRIRGRDGPRVRWRRRPRSRIAAGRGEIVTGSRPAPQPMTSLARAATDPRASWWRRGRTTSAAGLAEEVRPRS